MATVRIARGDLRGLDELGVDALALPMFRMKKQPTAVAGYADWRLAGRIGRHIMSGRFSGQTGESLLMTSLGRIGVRRVFLYGLGEPRELGETEAEHTALAFAYVLADAGVRDVAIAAPMMPGEGVSAKETQGRREVKPPAAPPALALKMLSKWLQVAQSASHPFEQVVLLDHDGGLLQIAPSLSEAAKRGGFEWRG